MKHIALIAAAIAAASPTIAGASCVSEQVANDHNAWVRGSPRLSGNPLWKLTPGSSVTYCGRHAFDSRKDTIDWHWVSFKSNEEPWNHEGWVSSRILEPVNVEPQSTMLTVPAATPTIVLVQPPAVQPPAPPTVIYVPDKSVEPSPERIIMEKCSTDWSKDFEMQEYCVEQQMKALTKLRNR